MAGHFSRKIYDNCYSIEFVDQQVDPCKYKTDNIYGQSNIQCHSLNGPRANKARSTGELGDTVYPHRVEIESMLHNLDVPDSKIISLNTMKEKNERLAKITTGKKINYTNCGKSQDYTYSRLDAPVNELRSVEIKRWEFPIIDPKEWVYNGYDKTEQTGNQRFGVNTQIAAKDKISKQNMRPFSVMNK